MSRISGSQNFTPVSTDSTDETSEVASSGASELVCSAEPQYSPVDTIQAHDEGSQGSSYTDPSVTDDGEAHPAYLLQATGGAIPEKSGEAEAEKEGAELPASHSHPEAEFTPTENRRVWVRNEHTDHKWKEQTKSEAKEPAEHKAGELEVEVFKAEKHSKALYSTPARLESEYGSVTSDFNIGQAHAGASAAGTLNLSEGKFGGHVGGSAGVDLINARVGAESQVGGVTLGAGVDAQVGVELNAGAKVEFDWKKKELEGSLGGGVTLARVGAEVKMEKGGVKTEAKADAEYGLEANVSFKAGMEDGKFKLHLDEAFALGIGEHANLAVEIDTKTITETAKKAEAFAEDLGHAAKTAVTDAVRSEVDDHLRAFAEFAQGLERLRTGR